MEEIWKDIPEYEGSYQVSNLGRVKSLEKRVPIRNGEFTRYYKGCILSNILGKRGYYVVSLGRRAQNKTVHRLAALAFIPNPKNKPCINHKDGNKLNNNVNNLEWCTYSENNLHGLRTGLITPPWKGKFGRDHHRSKIVHKLSLAGNYIETFGSAAEAARDIGLSSSAITNVLSGRPHQLTAGGYKWKYASEDT